MRRLLRISLPLIFVIAAAAQQAAPAPSAPPFTLKEVMIPMRDGVHLQTVILTPTNQPGPLPIMFRRTPYGVPDKPPATIPPNLPTFTFQRAALCAISSGGRDAPTEERTFGLHARFMTGNELPSLQSSLL